MWVRECKLKHFTSPLAPVLWGEGTGVRGTFDLDPSPRRFRFRGQGEGSQKSFLAYLNIS